MRFIPSILFATILLLLVGCSSGGNDSPVVTPIVDPSKTSYVPPKTSLVTTIPISVVNTTTTALKDTSSSLSVPPNYLPQGSSMRIYQSNKTEVPPNQGCQIMADTKSGIDIVLDSQPQGVLTISVPSLGVSTSERGRGLPEFIDIVIKVGDIWDFATDPPVLDTSIKILKIPAEKFVRRLDGKYTLEGTIIKLIQWAAPIDPKYELIQFGKEDMGALRPDKDIVLTHGIATDYKSMLPLAELIQKTRMYRRVYLYSYPWPGKLSLAGDKFNALVRKQITSTGQKVDFVSHSMGCVVTRYAYYYYGGITGVENIFLVSGPNNGINKPTTYRIVRRLTLNNPDDATCPTLGVPCIDDLAYDSRFITTLTALLSNTYEAANVWCFGEKNDEVVGYANGYGGNVPFENFTGGSVNRITLYDNEFGGLYKNHCYPVWDPKGRERLVNFIKNVPVRQDFEFTTSFRQLSSAPYKWRASVLVKNITPGTIIIVDAPVAVYTKPGFLTMKAWYTDQGDGILLPKERTLWNKWLYAGDSTAIGIDFTMPHFLPEQPYENAATMCVSFRYKLTKDDTVYLARCLIKLPNYDGTQPLPPLMQSR
jgi:pimeloyl-ACP methyl ester carboxylesterase